MGSGSGNSTPGRGGQSTQQSEEEFGNIYQNTLNDNIFLSSNFSS